MAIPDTSRASADRLLLDFLDFLDNHPANDMASLRANNTLHGTLALPAREDDDAQVVGSRVVSPAVVARPPWARRMRIER